MLRLSLNKVILVCILFFPITTILQGLSIFNIINKVVIFLMVFFILVGCFVDSVRVIDTIWILLAIGLSVYSYFITDGSFYNPNMVIYLGFWIIFFIYMKNQYSSLIELMEKNIYLIVIVVVAWNLLVFLSFFVEGSYVYTWGDRYFQSFSNGEHRFASTCLFTFSLGWILYKKKKQLKYLLLLIIPLIGFFICGARTYIGVLITYIIALCFVEMRNKKKFLFVSMIIIILLGVIVPLTPTGSKFLYTYSIAEESMDFWAAITNGRSLFWVIDMDAYSRLDTMDKLFGKGINYVYDINYSAGHGLIWAHNDFINILLTNGLAGLFMYLYVFYLFIKAGMKHRKEQICIKEQVHRKGRYPIIRVFFFIVIWAVNAMFNMVYTYTCSVLVMPFILYSLMKEDKEEHYEIRKIN